MTHIKLVSFLYVMGSLLFGSSAWAVPNTFVFQGQIVKPDGAVLENASVNFTVQIFSPGAEECLLYQESHSGVNMSDSKGLFSLAVGSGSRSAGNFEDSSVLSQITDLSLIHI